MEEPLDELKARVVDFVRANPGCSPRAMRGKLGCADLRLAHLCDGLVAEGVLENLGSKSARRLHVVGDTPARPSAGAGVSVLERVLICPDAHHPYADSQAWETFLAVARDWRPDTLVILGDFGDFYGVSGYTKDPARRLSFAEELRAVNAELDRVEALRVPRVIFIEGNHETRLARYVADKAPALAGIVDDVSLLNVQSRGWEWVPYGRSATVGKLHFAHDVGHSGVYAARQSVAAMGANIIFGHTHRAGCHYESTVSGERHVGWTCGWLGDAEYIDYKHRARVLRENQHGFGVAYVERGTGHGWVHFVPILGGRCVVDGRMISA